MKIFISADIEGTTGIAHWNETEKGLKDYEYFQEQMTREVKAACKGALKGGATEIIVKDAHDSARNINPRELPKEVKINRGWAKHPFSMVYGIDESFDAVMFIGYHSPAYGEGNPLAHTMNGNIVEIRLNGVRTSEFLMHSMAAQSVGVPSIFISGDKKLMEHAKAINPNIKTLAVSEGIGNSSTSIHPDLAVEEIEKIVEGALKGDLNKYKIEMPETFVFEVEFVHHYNAYRGSFYPGAEKIDEKTVRYTSNNYFDIMRAAMFLL